jgi:hypothetical protein
VEAHGKAMQIGVRCTYFSFYEPIIHRRVVFPVVQNEFGLLLFLKTNSTAVIAK